MKTKKMSDPIRTHAEALKEAAHSAAKRTEGNFKWDAMIAARKIEDEIRALASRIAAPDDEALVEIILRVFISASNKTQAAVAHELITALREAGALR